MTKEKKSSQNSLIIRLLPIAFIITIIIGVFASGAYKILTFDNIAIAYGDMSAFVNENLILAIFSAFLIYTFATAVSFPAAWLLSVSTGLVFGWLLGSFIVLFGATFGAVILFLSARYAFSDFFKKRAGGILSKMAMGFKDGAASYLLFLRLVPLFPFALVNVVPAIVGVKFSTFVWTSFVGIIPGVIAYNFAGEGLRSIVAERALACANNIMPCGEGLNASDLVTKEILIAFIVLGLVALIPIFIKKFHKKTI